MFCYIQIPKDGNTVHSAVRTKETIGQCSKPQKGDCDKKRRGPMQGRGDFERVKANADPQIQHCSRFITMSNGANVRLFNF